MSTLDEVREDLSTLRTALIGAEESGNKLAVLGINVAITEHERKLRDLREAGEW